MQEVQNWLDKKYPVNSVCKRKSDSENKNKRREEIITLNISKGKIEKNDEENLTNFLKLEGFTDLQELIIGSRQLTGLDISDCPNLKKIDCSGNKLVSLDLNSSSQLKELNCSRNKLSSLKFLDSLLNLEKMTYLNISDNEFSSRGLSFLGRLSKLEEINVSCTNISIDNVFLGYLPKKTLKMHCEEKQVEKNLKKYYNETFYNFGDWVINELFRENEELKQKPKIEKNKDKELEMDEEDLNSIKQDLELKDQEINKLKEEIEQKTISEEEREKIKKLLSDYLDSVNSEIEGHAEVINSKKFSLKKIEECQKSKKQYEAKVEELKPLLTKINNWK